MRFNEAAGRTPRKPCRWCLTRPCAAPCFNEAAGRTPRKHAEVARGRDPLPGLASMRPRGVPRGSFAGLAQILDYEALQ